MSYYDLVTVVTALVVALAVSIPTQVFTALVIQPWIEKRKRLAQRHDEERLAK